MALKGFFCIQESYADNESQGLATEWGCNTACNLRVELMD